MNQGKLEVVKQELARVNIDILGISEQRWTEMGEFNSDDHYIYYCGQESHRRNGVAIIVNKKSLKCSTWMQSKKRQNYLCLFPRQTIQYAEYITQNAGLDEAQAGIKIAGRNINNLRYADDTTLMAESEQELKSLLMRMKEESVNASLKLNIKKQRSWHLVPSLHGKLMRKKWKQ